MTQTAPPAGTTRRGRRTVRNRLELYFEEGSQPNARLYRWRLRSGANGKKLGHGGQGFTERGHALGNARTVTGYDLARDPDFTEPQPGIDGLVSVWLVDPRARRGYPG